MTGAARPADRASSTPASPPRPFRLRAPLFSPRGYLLWALSFGLIFLGLHLGGLREYASAISLTVPEGSTLNQAAFLCILYLALYVLCLVVCPVLVLAAGIQTLLQHLLWGSKGA